MKRLLFILVAVTALYAQAANPFLILGDRSSQGAPDRDGAAISQTNTVAYGIEQALRGHNIIATVISHTQNNATVADFADGTTLSQAIMADINPQEPPLAVAWIQGDADIAAGTSAQTYADALDNLRQRIELVAGRSVKFIIAQSASQGAHYYASAAKADAAAMNTGISGAQLGLAVSDPDHYSILPTYQYDYCRDLITPDSKAQTDLGRAIVDAYLSADAPFTAGVSSVRDNEITLHFPTVCAVDTVSVTCADNYGFTIVRGSGKNERHLSINAINISGSDITLSTRESIISGDRVVYGSFSQATGAMCGSRGNIVDATGRHAPLFAIDINSVTRGAANITGTVTCDGAPVAGVAVSDGYSISVTDAEGRYYLQSNKSYGYVFYTLPSGYEPEVESNGFQVKIYSLLKSTDESVSETHNFKLTRVDNTNHILLVGADAHLAKRAQDLAQFKKLFIPRVNSFIAANPGTKIYSTILGDMSWDAYWTSNSYGLPEFVQTMTEYKYPLMLFPVMGNHDNDPSIAPGNDTDFLAAQKYRQTIAPSYYSFNLGEVHYVVLDDIIYTNTAVAGTNYGAGIAGSRDYDKYYTNEQLEWLRNDLAAVNHNTPVVVMFHIPNWALSTNGKFTVKTALTNGASDALAKLLADFDQVQLLSGHTHYNYHVHPGQYPNIHENNVAAICATWWWTGRYSSRHICKDGSPGGFASYTADGYNLTWKYHSMEQNDDPQFRIYDMNTVKSFYNSNTTMKTILAAYPSRTNYGAISDNMVYVNVFNYDTDWKVEIYEGNTLLKSTRINAEDPLHNLVYDVAKWKATGSITEGFAGNLTGHMFSAAATTATEPITVRVTDSFGIVYSQTLQRPITFNENLGL